jgi:hypothetical protein
LFAPVPAGNAASKQISIAGGNTLMKKAQQYEADNDYARAIETYLSISMQDTTNVDELETVSVP